MDRFLENMQDVLVSPTVMESTNLMTFEGDFSPMSKVLVNCWSQNGLPSKKIITFPLSVGELVEMFDETYAFLHDLEGNIVHQGMLSDCDTDNTVTSLVEERLKRMRP